MKNIKILCLILFGALFATSAMAERLLVVMIGQSETSGRGDLSQVPTYPNASRIWLYGNDGVWHNPASEPTDSNVNQLYSVEDDGAMIGASFGMPLANRLADLHPTDEIAIINCSKGNSLIEQFRRYWDVRTRYGSCYARVLEALKTSKLYGITFYVGATDSQTQAAQQAWRENFSNLIAAWRTDLGDLNVPVAVARYNNLPHTSQPYWAALRADQGYVVARNVKFVSTDSIDYDPINVHPTTSGNQVLGPRFADALHSMH